MMKNLQAIIIDDEQASIDSLIWELESFQDRIDILETFTNPNNAIEFISNNSIDLVFLDIEMPEINGFEWLDKFDNPSFKVIFTTAYDQFALKAFEVNAYDYLLKPINEEDLLRAINKVDNEKWQDALENKITAILSKINTSSKKQHVAIPTSEGLEFIDIDNIIRCSSESNYTFIHLVNEKPLLVAKTLKEIINLLPFDNFIRIHHSHLINLNFLKKYLKGKAGSVVLKDGSVIPISRSKKSDFLEEI